MKPVAQVSPDVIHDERHKPRFVKGEFVPVYVAMGLVVLALSFASHTAKQQLAHSPGVTIRKKKRETMQEVEDPDGTAGEAENFIGKSFFRKVAHLQDMDARRAGISDPTRPDPFHHPRTVETLKSVGVDPRA